jgi:hypothetical protein
MAQERGAQKAGFSGTERRTRMFTGTLLEEPVTRNLVSANLINTQLRCNQHATNNHFVPLAFL